MYLSKIILDVRHPSVRQALRDVNDMHRNLMSGFDIQPGQNQVRAEKHILFRVVYRRDQVFMLVSSSEKPDVKALSARGFYTDETMIREISALRERFKTGRCLRFELLASPCRKVSGNGNNSRRNFLRTTQERADWLQHRGEMGGFEIIQTEEIGGYVDVCGRRNGVEIKKTAVLYSGLLRITDEDAFWVTFTEGIGPGKAYGLGMLNLANA